MQLLFRITSRTLDVKSLSELRSMIHAIKIINLGARCLAEDLYWSIAPSGIERQVPTFDGTSHYPFVNLWFSSQ